MQSAIPAGGRLPALFLTLVLPGAFSLAHTTGSERSTVVVEWNEAALQAIRVTGPAPPVVARALAIVHSCMYEAWAPYHRRALGLLLGRQLRRPASERTPATVEKAVSYAAYRCLTDLFPAVRTSLFDPVMRAKGYDINDVSTDIRTPQGLANLAASVVLASRRDDGANQNGLMTASGVPYADYTGYVPVNSPSTLPTIPGTISDVNHWQPLQYPDASGTFITQRYTTPFWGQVRPFSLQAGSEFRSLLSSLAPVRYGDAAFVVQAQEMLDLSAGLTDEHKMIAEYWADGPRSETPPGHWNLFAQYVSRRDSHDIGDDVKMFFALNNAVLDAGIVAWDAKLLYDSSRPVTAIPFLFAGRMVQAWGGPGRGTVTMDGRDWTPYQISTFPTPPFPEFVSGHSTFSAAAATVLASYTGSETFGASITLAPGSSKYEPGITPKMTVTLRWNTFADAADQAGMSRQYGGIHFRRGDHVGRVLGRMVGLSAFQKSAQLWDGGTRRSRRPWSDFAEQETTAR